MPGRNASSKSVRILDAALAKPDTPLAVLIARFNAKLDDEADRLDSATRLHIEAVDNAG